MKNKPNDGSLKAPRTLRSAFSGMEKQDELDTMIVRTTNAWYDAKHPVKTIDEIKMINSPAIAVIFTRTGSTDSESRIGATSFLSSGTITETFQGW